MHNGCYLLWSSISVYVLSYYYLYDKSINQNGIFYVDFFFVFLDCLGCQLGTYLLETLNLGPRIVLAIGGSIAIISMAIASTVTEFWQFVLLSGLSGVGYGINYFIPLVCGWSYFPSRRGLITGILVAAYGFGALLWTILSYHIVNPDNE